MSDLNRAGQHIAWFDDLGSGNEEFRFLSNFYRAPFSLPGVRYPGEESLIVFLTGEHAFQAMKASSLEEFRMIVETPDPSSAKTAGRLCNLRPDWEVVKYDVMAAVVRAKFSPGSPLGERLLATGDALLTEGTFWHDKVWGVDLGESGLPGRNWLGTLLMARRAELRAIESNPGASVHHRTEEWNLSFFLPEFLRQEVRSSVRE